MHFLKILQSKRQKEKGVQKLNLGKKNRLYTSAFNNVLVELIVTDT